MTYQCIVAFHGKKTMRKFLLDLETSLYDLALLLYSSLVKEKNQEDYSFQFVFGEDSYVTRKDEQDDLFGYSTRHYHVLDDESFKNAIIRQSNSASFQIIKRSLPENYVMSMELGELMPTEESIPLKLIDGEGIIAEDYRIIPADFQEIIREEENNLPVLRRRFRYKRPKTI